MNTREAEQHENTRNLRVKVITIRFPYKQKGQKSSNAVDRIAHFDFFNAVYRDDSGNARPLSALLPLICCSFSTPLPLLYFSITTHFNDHSLAIRWPFVGHSLAIRWPFVGHSLAIRWPVFQSNRADG